MRVYKYEIPGQRDRRGNWEPINYAFTLDTPYYQQALSVQVQDGIPVIWLAVSPEKDSGTWNPGFYIVATGQDIPQAAGRFVGTFQLDILVWHVFQGQGWF
jgi:hypothetical protein